MDEKKQRIELMTTHTASGVRPTEEIGPEPVIPPLDLPAFQGTHSGYDVGAEIARGGMGRIVEAHDRRQDRPVALKFLLRPDAVSAKRFAREAWITGRLQHPSIIPLYESGRWETGEPFFARAHACTAPRRTRSSPRRPLMWTRRSDSEHTRPS
jgi:hypothetical protein